MTTDPRSLLEAAAAAIDMEEWAAAAKLAEGILTLDPENEDALLIKAEALTHLDRVMDSDIILDGVLERNPGSVTAHILSVFNSMAVMDLGKALEYADRGLEIAPEEFDLVMSKAQLLYWLGDPEYKLWIERAQGIDWDRTLEFMEFHWIKEVPPTHPASVTMNLLPKITDAVEEKRYRKALRLIEDALGSSMEAIYDTGELREALMGLEVECRIGLGDLKGAGKNVKRLLKDNPKNPHAWLYRAQISLYSKDLPAALEAIDRCIKVAEEVDFRRPDFYFTKAFVLEKMGDDRAARKYIEMGEREAAENARRMERMLRGVPELGEGTSLEMVMEALQKFVTDNYSPEELKEAARTGYPYDDPDFDEGQRTADMLDWFVFEYVRPESGKTPVREFAEMYDPPLRERILQMEDIHRGPFEVMGVAVSREGVPEAVRLKGPGGRLFDTLIPAGWEPRRGQVVKGRLYPWDGVYRLCGMVSIISPPVPTISPETLMDIMEADLIQQAEDKSFREDSSLRTILNRYPWQWVNAMSVALGFDAKGRKKEKVARIVSVLTSDRLSDIIEDLPEDSREALAFVMSKGGWFKYYSLSRRYDAGMGFWWNDDPPCSPVGLLRLHGLLVVGRMRIKGRRYKVAMVPREVRERLGEDGP
jgi:tetratricopeptide (TPR) repeat protein